MSFTGTERYELLRTLGQGGMGTVYAVYDRRRERRVALKVLSDPEGGSLFRFKREFRGMADLRHPNLVRLYDLGVLPAGGFFFTMELVEGRDLAAWADRRGGEAGATLSATVKALAETREERTARWTEAEADSTVTAAPAPAAASGARAEEVAAVLVGVGEGLRALHAARKVHRDLKPSNVLVEEDGRARLLDFGILRDLDRGGLTGEAAVGTPLYMAPELVAGDEVTPAVDLYSLGCMLYRLLSGAPPFTGRPTRLLWRHLREAPTPPSRVRPCDARLEALCLELLAKEPAARPGLDAAMARLREVAGERAPPPAVAPAPPPRTPDLVGREGELAALEVAWSEAAAGPRIVLIAGESGAGKSALAAELAQRLAGEVPGWFGGCYEREHVPYKAFDALVDAAAIELSRRGEDAFRLLPPGTQALARMFPVLREVAAVERLEPETPLRDPEAERARAGRALFALLSNLSGGRPPLLVLDDLQRADAESVDALAWLTHAASAPRCLVLGTFRPGEVGEGHPLAALLALAGGGHPVVSRLDLPPLDPEAARALAQACATTRLGEGPLRRLEEDAQGNPFLIVELARASSELARDALPTVAELVAARLARVGPEARALVEVAAVAGHRAPFALLAEAAELEPAAAADALDELLRVQLLREVQGPRGEDAYGLIHDRVRQAVYEAVEPARRTLLHRALAERLGAHEDAARAVEHWRLAGEATRARQAALQAAERAEGQLAFDRAAELYGLAARSDAGWELEEARARALARAGRHREAAEAYERALAGAPAERGRELRLVVMTERLAAGDVAGGMQRLDAILRELGSRLRRSTWVTLLVIAVRMSALSALWFLQDLFGRRAKAAGRCAQPPDPEQAYRLRVYDIAHTYLSMYRPLEGVRLGTRHALLARRHADPVHQGRARIGYALFLSTEARGLFRGRAQHHLAIGEALCAEGDDAHGQLLGLVTRALLYLLAGNWEGIRRVSAEGEALARRAGLHGEPMLMVLENVHLAGELLRGDTRTAVHAAEAYLQAARARGNLWGVAWPLSMLGYGLLLQGETTRAAAALDEALALTPAEPLTLVRVHVELQASARYFADGRAAEGLAALADLRRRWRENGLFASDFEAALLRLAEARLRLLAALQGDVPCQPCRVHGALRGRGPLAGATTLTEELLRVAAAAELQSGRPRAALRLLGRAVIAADARGDVLGLGLAHTARGHVRARLGEPGSALDLRRGAELLAAAGASDCYLLRAEGWLGKDAVPRAPA